jgi:hypothetical protein
LDESIVEIISWKEAFARGLSRYYTGKPCKRGHIAERKVASRTCCVCDRERASHERTNKKEIVAARKRRYAEKNKCIIDSYKKSYNAKNKDRICARQKRRYEENKASILKKQREYFEKNRETILLRVLRHQSENKWLTNARNARRRARKMSAVPCWFSEFDQFVWAEAADIANRRSIATGIQWEADHMIPLASRGACGLYVGLNCQVIPQALNCRKGAKMIMTEPLEWLMFI